MNSVVEPRATAAARTGRSDRVALGVRCVHVCVRGGGHLRLSSWTPTTKWELLESRTSSAPPCVWNTNLIVPDGEPEDASQPSFPSLT